MRIPIWILALGAALVLAGCSEEQAGPVDGRAQETPPQSTPTAVVLQPTAARSDAGGAWSQGARMNTARAEMAATELDGRIYTGGGLNRNGANISAFEVFDPAAGRWEERAPLPLTLDHFAMAGLDGRVYVVGGSTNFRARNQTLSTALFAYDPASDSWNRLTDMRLRRWGHSMVALDGLLYVIGGWGDEARVTLVYDPATDSWSRRAPLSTEREHLGAVVHEGRIYAVGGRWGTSNSGRVEVYDPATDSWEQRASLPTPRSGIGVALSNGRIHVFGGEAFNPARVFPDHEVYTIGTDTWESASPLPTPRHGLVAVGLGNQVHTIGGLGMGTASITDLVEIWTQT